MGHLLCALWAEEEGQTLVEYSLIVALISVTIITALGLVSGKIQAKYSDIRNAM